MAPYFLRQHALAFGLGCALFIAVLGAGALEGYLRWQERERLAAHEFQVESAPPAPAAAASSGPPSVSAQAGPVPAAPRLETALGSPQAVPAQIVAGPSGPPKVVLLEPVITHDAGELSPEKRLIYHATYTTDAMGRRVTPQPEGPRPARAVLAVGCSYTFGLGVNDDQSMPWQLALRLPDRAVYNYGVAGYGPQHTLELFKGSVEKEVSQRKTALVYSYICEHMDRAVGTPKFVRWYGGPFPWYELDETSGRPVRKGTFREREAQAAGAGSRLVEAIRDYRAEKRNSRDAKLTALLLDEARLRFEKRFESDGFYFLIYPGKQNGFTEEVAGILRAGGARVLDYRNLPDGNKERWFIRDDGHPNPELYRLVAEKLAADLSTPCEK